MERGQTVLEFTFIEEEEELWQDDDGEYDGWFCVRTEPFPCPAAGCTFVAEFMTAAHLILVQPGAVPRPLADNSRTTPQAS